VESTRDLTQKQYLELVGRIKQRGSQTGALPWKPVHKSAKKSGMDKEPPPQKKHRLSRIEALPADMKLPRSNANAIFWQMFGLQYMKWCEPPQLAAVIYRMRMKSFIFSGALLMGSAPLYPSLPLAPPHLSDFNSEKSQLGFRRLCSARLHESAASSMLPPVASWLAPWSSSRQSPA